MKTYLLNREVELQILQFAPQSYFLGFHIFQHTTQEIAEKRQHLLRLRSLLLAHQHHDGIECVEQEVWLQLHFQRAELRIHQLRLQFGRVEFQSQCLFRPLLIPVVVVQSVLDCKDGPIRNNILVKTEHREKNQRHRKRTHDRGKDAQPGKNGCFYRNLSHGKHQREQQVQKSPAQPAIFVKGEPFPEPDHEGRKQRKDVASDEPRHHVV